MTTPDPAAIAIEAATKAINREAASDSLTIVRLDPESEYWDLSGVLADARDLAEVAYAAMEPHIRKTVAEQIALAIKARRAVLVQTDEWDDGTDSLEAAAEIARETGKATP